MPFKVPLGFRGDCYDRYLQRIEEMRQSINIIENAINYIPYRPLQQATKMNFPTRKDIRTSMEALIKHFKYYAMGNYIIKNNISYLATEAPKGEFGTTLITNNSRKPYRCKIKAPGFAHLQGFNFMAHNHLLADVVAIIGTQDIVFGEIDR